ncbi:MAG: hypothetical protein HZB26_15865 [Candidatus Hydrogenedentes bacterium]|nr:hypothetical protein [Candidatus Hydrogenedentota bacterium]
MPEPDDHGLLSVPSCDLLSGLTEEAGDALSQTIQLLSCGEESAIHVFYNEGDRIGASQSSFLQSQAIMYRIAKEETLHDLMLTRVSELLPYDERHHELRRRARHFYLRLAHPEPKYHFFRISELDSVVCMIMHGLLTGTGKLATSPALSKIAAHIRDDEAGHVRATRERVVELGMTLSERLEEAEPIRTRIVEMLSDTHEALDTLGVDADQLFKRILARKTS